MRTFIIYIDEVGEERRVQPELILANSLLDLLKKLDGRNPGDFEMWFNYFETDTEEEVSEKIDYSNGDGDRWYSIAEMVNGDKLKIWLGN